MVGNITFTIIKPSAFADGHTGEVLAIIEKAGFRIKSIKKVWLTKNQASRFYDVHIGKPFYDDLVRFMCSGPIVAAVLEKENAIEEFRTLIGATDPAKAAPGTIRKLFGKTMGENAIHGSDSDENAIKESCFFFSLMEQG
ncbi:MAG: nucleoside-diphosphate kinase [Bacteroidales bacterium]|nr:nucleoside-diphosphate kinase [Bacteroidales bacterium]MDD4603130.1 nucleoside-diphosphate kinase [Bacteroidales bacterium]